MSRTIYQCVIGDGYTYDVCEHDEGAPARESYWVGLRLAEVSCPHCSETGRDDDGEECEHCQGSGLTEGEPFTVYRYDGLSDDVAEKLLDNPGDGYDWTSMIHELAGDGVEVLNWEPETV